MSRKYIPEKVKRILQKEINSECPFCDNTDVDHFQVHHIDEDSSNDFPDNLLMLCAICHSKITKGDITQAEVLIVKKQLPQQKPSIEFVSVVPDEYRSCWVLLDNITNVFISERSSENREHLVLNWSFINNTKSTIILKSLSYSAISLPVGLTGIVSPSKLEPIATYSIPIHFDKGSKLEHLTPQIQIPEGHGFQIQTEHFSLYNDMVFALGGRFYIDFVFEFSSNLKVEIPRLFYNCRSENEQLRHYVMK
tara:strand:- start:2628 stop:3380 length:753 start_codon:yes stop_codon:yes gene_type:complete